MLPAYKIKNTDNTDILKNNFPIVENIWWLIITSMHDNDAEIFLAGFSMTVGNLFEEMFSSFKKFVFQTLFAIKIILNGILHSKYWVIIFFFWSVMRLIWCRWVTFVELTCSDSCEQQCHITHELYSKGILLFMLRGYTNRIIL